MTRWPRVRLGVGDRDRVGACVTAGGACKRGSKCHLCTLLQADMRGEVLLSDSSEVQVALALHRQM